MVNSFTTFSEIHGIQNARQLRYRNNLIVQLVGNVRNKQNVSHGRHSTGDAAELLNKQPHFIAKAPSGRNKNCLVCSRKGHRKTIVFFCETCTRKPGLHPGECFKKYHTLTDYKQKIHHGNFCDFFYCFVFCSVPLNMQKTKKTDAVVYTRTCSFASWTKKVKKNFLQ